MINLDDLDPPRPVLKPLDLQQMSIEDLENYILSLEGEIIRAQDMIASKQAHRNGLDSLFKK